MIIPPYALANRTPPFPPSPLPDLSAAGLVAEDAAASVAAAQGDPGLFAGALAAAVEADPEVARDRGRALDAVSVAAWRSGALALRDDALSRLGRLTAPESRGSAAAALGIGVDRFDEFVLRQATDRFWWPDRGVGDAYVHAVGGFVGVGGAWIRPPERWGRYREAGAFAFLVAGEWWRLDADVWGAHLGVLPEPPTTLIEAADDGVTVWFGRDSHIVWIRARDRE